MPGRTGLLARNTTSAVGWNDEVSRATLHNGDRDAARLNIHWRYTVIVRKTGRDNSGVVRVCGNSPADACR